MAAIKFKSEINYLKLKLDINLAWNGEKKS